MRLLRERAAEKRDRREERRAGWQIEIYNYLKLFITSLYYFIIFFNTFLNFFIFSLYFFILIFYFFNTFFKTTLFSF